MSPWGRSGATRPTALDRLFGGKAGDAEKARRSMERSYGRKKGATVFEATVIRRQARAKRSR